MKKIISILTAFSLMIAVISCGGNKEANQTLQNMNKKLLHQIVQKQKLKKNSLI